MKRKKMSAEDSSSSTKNSERPDIGDALITLYFSLSEVLNGDTNCGSNWTALILQAEEEHLFCVPGSKP